eukprot:c16077_g1_i2 orf=139-321(+)
MSFGLTLNTNVRYSHVLKTITYLSFGMQYFGAFNITLPMLSKPPHWILSPLLIQGQLNSL